MSDLDRVIARGSGSLEYRLVIAGAAQIWVTNAAMAGTQADGRERVHGLIRKGLQFSETVQLLDGTLEQEAFAATIVDKSGRATAVLTAECARKAYLKASVSASDTAWTVSSSVDLLSQYMHIGQELVLVTATPTATTITVTRAQWGTTATAHYVQTGETTAYPVLRDVPPHLINRRAELYAHGKNELGVTETGTRVWYGLVSAGARILQSAAAYEIPLSPLSRVLEQNIGPKTKKPLNFSGIYYAATGAVWFVCDEHAGAGFETARAYSFTVQLAGRFTTQAEFRVALQAAFDAAKPVGWTTDITVVDDGDGWDLLVSTAAGAARYVSLYGGSAVDGQWGGALGLGGMIDADTGARVLTVTTATAYKFTRSDTPLTYPGGISSVLSPAERAIAWPEGAECAPRTVPRACYTSTGPLDYDAADYATYPPYRLFLEDVSGLVAGDELTADPMPFSGFVHVGSISSVDPTGGSVDLALYDEVTATYVPTLFELNQVGFDGQWKIRATKRYGLVPGTLTDFRDALVAASADAVPGQGPRVFAADLGDWAVADEVATGHAFLSRRHYLFTEPTKLGDMLEHECRLYGLVPYIDASQKIQLRRLAPVLPTDVATLTIDASKRGVSSGFGQMEDLPDGIITTAELSTDWDAAENKHQGPKFTVQNVVAISDAGAERILEIKPMVRADSEPRTVEEIVDVCFGRTALYGDRYLTVSLTSTMRAFNALLGDVVDVDIPQLPLAGARGFRRKGRLISRDWDLDTGRGQLKVVFFAAGPAGYAPSALVDTATVVSGNTWDLLIDMSEYFEAGASLATFFAAGFGVRMTQRRTATPTTLQGTVVSVTGSTVRVLFSAPFTSRADDVLEFDTRAGCVAAQVAWAFIAQATGRHASPAGLPQTFSP